MPASSIGRIVLPSLALVAASCAAVVFGIAHIPREPPVETRAAVAAPPASGARDEGSAALATAEAEANAVGAALAGSPGSAVADESVPVFDIARIERTGDAVIAGRAPPGAVVELLRNGEQHHREVADQSGQFVMVPPRLPRGNYQLTLRSRQPDGRQETSKQSVVVALDEVEPNSGAVQSRAEVPFTVPETAVANRQPPQATAATPPSDGGSSSAVDAPKVTSRVVSRGDSLWRISQITYGAGMRYAIVYKANREQIRNPNRIYPGQIFVLPMNAR
jgi:hypothetical protein